MKTMFKFFIPLLLLTVFGCQSSAPIPQVTDIILVVDLSDPLLVNPNPDDLITGLRLKDDIWQGVNITITFISDKDINNTIHISLESEDRWTGNTTIRSAKVEHFKKQLRSSLTRNNGTGSLGHSIIYRNVANEANVLSTSSATKKYLLVYSDLMENDEVSFYNHKTIEALNRNPATIQHRLEKTVPLNTLTGIQVWLLYEPPSYNANNTYMGVAHFYKAFLDSKGAITHIGHSFNL